MENYASRTLTMGDLDKLDKSIFNGLLQNESAKNQKLKMASSTEAYQVKNDRKVSNDDEVFWPFGVRHYHGGAGNLNI